jgi:hypothetical protein
MVVTVGFGNATKWPCKNRFGKKGLPGTLEQVTERLEVRHDRKE